MEQRQAASRTEVRRRVNLSTPGEADPVRKHLSTHIESHKIDADVKLVLKGDHSSQQLVDPFQAFYGGGGGSSTANPLNILPTPFSFPFLLRIARDNAMLRQCIEAMVTNVEGHGYRFEFEGDEKDKDTPKAQGELQFIEQFFAQPNESYSLIELRKRLRWDLEILGNAFMEVSRDRQGMITGLWHLPGHLMRLTEADREHTAVEMLVPGANGIPKKEIKNRHFRRIVQRVGARTVYFKEFGDPRVINPATGQEEGVAHDQSATEVFHLKLYYTSSEYGAPRWINQIPSIQGSRQAELTNLEYFSDNAIPAMAVLVSGGTVTQDTMDVVEQAFTMARGRDNANRVAFIEATGSIEASSEHGTIPPPRIEIKALRDGNNSDSMYQSYEKDCFSKIRSSFRLPPLFLGQSETYTHATAKTSFEVAESQVFGPERNSMDDIFNRRILPSLSVTMWRFKSNPPRISDPEEVIDAIDVFDKTGALTPNIAIGFANEFFDSTIPQIDQEWGNWPFTLVTAFATSPDSLPGGQEVSDELGEIVDVEAEEIEGDENETRDRVSNMVRRHLIALRRKLVGKPESTDGIKVRQRVTAPDPEEFAKSARRANHN